jgi:hypothetical protein
MPDAQPTTSDLSSLTLSGTATGYAYSAGTYSYNGITVPNATSSVTVTPTGSGAITVNGASLASGSASDPISLTAGSATTITVVVADPGKAATTYTLSVTRLSAVTLAVGDRHGGGIVCYILQSGDTGYDPDVQHGLISATRDQSTGIVWAIPAWKATAVPALGAIVTAIGAGLANTDAIIAQNGAGTTYAAGLARACGDGGYGDWYLPSKNELSTLYTNRAAIGNFNSSGVYWSSSENSGSSVFGKSFNNGGTAYGNKDVSWCVRAVRAF